MSDSNTDSDLPIIHEYEQTSNQSQSNINNNYQIPCSVRDFSSQYGSDRSYSYVVQNICSGVDIYPQYGDSQRALVFRTYGPWWLNTSSHQYSIKYFTRFEPSFTSRDYIDIEYERAVHIQCLHLYETYNPGTLEVVYAGLEETAPDQNIYVKWFRIWRFPEPFTIELSDIQNNCRDFLITDGFQSIEDIFHDRKDILLSSKKNDSLWNRCKLSQISKLHTYHQCPPASRLPRIVKIELADKIKFPCKLIRLEFDHSTVSYYTEIDTVILISKPLLPLNGTIESNNNSSLLELCDFMSQKLANDDTIIPLTETTEEYSSLTLNNLPFDILFTICTYLDLRSLVRLSSTCRYLYDKCLHPLQFQTLNLQPYWYGITNYSIDNFFSLKCTQIKYLSLAWTKSIHLKSFTQLLNTQKLIQLNLACCQYINRAYIDVISKQCQQLEIINLENCFSLISDDFIALKNLKNLKSINFYRTKIDHRTLIPLIKNNYLHLEYVNLGACQQLSETDYIVKLLFSKCLQLKALDLWRAHGLSQNGFLSIIGERVNVDEEKQNPHDGITDELLNNLTTTVCCLENLKELDFGWCDLPPNFIQKFVKNCGKSLMKLFLTACRRITNDDMIAIGEYCPQLKQLDILGSRIINEESIHLVLKKCTNLEFLDLSFCDKIESKTIDMWNKMYKQCKSIKRSYSPRDQIDDIYTEFA